MRRTTAATSLFAALALALWLARPAPPAAVEAPAEPRWAPPIATIGATPAPEPLADRPSPEATAFRGRAEAVEARCGLELHTRCSGDTCVAVTTAPDMDRAQGWARLALRSPRFVLSTAARDLGLPLAALPCAGAIGGLPERTAAIELPDGTEVWCTGAAEAHALCDAAATELLGAGAEGFSAPDVRVLSFGGT